MDVLADAVALRHRLDHVGREVVGMRRREPDPAESVDLVHLPEQVGEEGSPRRSRDRDIPAVRVHVLTQQRHLDHAMAHEALDLGEHVADRPGALRAPDERHDAERAGVVASRRRSTPRRGTRHRAPTAAPTGTGRCTRRRPSADRRRRPAGGGPADAGARVSRSRRRPRAPSPGSPPGPSGRGSRRPRSEGPGSRPSAASGVPGCRTACCPRSRGSRTCSGRSTRASATSSVGVMPSARSIPPIRSESCSFIWHPKVRIRNVPLTSPRLPCELGRARLADRPRS